MKKTRSYDLMAGLVICAMGILIWKNAHITQNSASSGATPETIKSIPAQKPAPIAPKQPTAPASGGVQMVAQAKFTPGECSEAG